MWKQFRGSRFGFSAADSVSFLQNEVFRLASYQVQEIQTPYLPELPKEITLDSLLAQFNLFEAFQAGNEVWAANTGNPESEHLHHDIVELLGQMRENYTILLDKYSCYHSKESTP